jgi:hypothetical protein
LKPALRFVPHHLEPFRSRILIARPMGSDQRQGGRVKDGAKWPCLTKSRGAGDRIEGFCCCSPVAIRLSLASRSHGEEGARDRRKSDR